MLSYLASTNTTTPSTTMSPLDTVATAMHRDNHSRTTDGGRLLPTATNDSCSSTEAASSTFPWRSAPVDNNDLHLQRHYSSNGRGLGGIFPQPPPLNLTDYSPSSPRLFPSPYASYFGPPSAAAASSSSSTSTQQCLAPSAPRYFFPFPPPLPPPPLPPPPPPSSRQHYLQIESYSAILASMGGGGPPVPHPTPGPARPTPIFSTNSSSAAASAAQSDFGGHLTSPPSHIVHFSPPSNSNSSGQLPYNVQNLQIHQHQQATPVTSPNSCPSSSAVTEDGGGTTLLSPCQSPSYRSYPQGSLKHRILVRPESKVPTSPSGAADVVVVHPPETTSNNNNNHLGLNLLSRSRPSPSTQPPPQQPQQKPSPTPVLTRALLSGVVVPAPPASSSLIVETPKEEVKSNNCSTVQQPPQQLQYPAHFMKGAIIQLANGELKCVEDLRTEDFVQSADLSQDLRIDSSTVVRIDEHARDASSTAALTFLVGDQRIQVTVDASLEHPFFVFGRGWSSCCPERTMQRYALQCHRLQVGDVCISLTHRRREGGDGMRGDGQRAEDVVEERAGHLQRSRLLPTTGAGSTFRPKILPETPAIGSSRRSVLRRRKRRWSASDAVALAAASAEQRSVSLADADDCSS